MLWTVAWALFLGRYVVFFWMPQGHGPSLVPVVYATMALVGAYLLLWGVRDFLGQPWPRRWLWLLVTTYVWTFVGVASGVSFLWSTLPCATALAATYGRCGVELWRAPRLEFAGRILAGLGFAMWCLVQASYSFIINQPFYAQYGYIVTTGLEVWAAIGLLLVFFQHNHRELMEAQIVLTQSKERLRLVLENMPLLMYALDHQGKVTMWNRECEMATGYPSIEMLGREDAAARLFPQADAFVEELADWASPEAEFRQRELETTCADGSLKLIAWSNISRIVPIPGWSAWGVGVDLSERQRARQALKQLTAGVAHNFNNVLMAVMGNLQAAVPLMADDGPAAKQAADLVANALKSAAAGREVGARLGSFAGQGATDHRPTESLELAPAVQAALDLARTGWSHLGLNKVEFRTRLDHGVFVRARQGELMEVLLNLIKNALEAMPNGGVLSLTQEEENDEVRLAFSDTGSGMDPQIRDRAFDPFFSTKGTAVRGLGLSTSKGLLQSFGGDLEVQDRPGPGATLVVKLRRAGPAETIAAELPTTEQKTGGHVLLVEDEALVALGLEAMLTQAGYTVQKAGSLNESRSALSHKIPEVILCDMVLPDGFGWDLLEDLRLQDSQDNLLTPLIILTGWSPEIGQERAMELDRLAEAILKKPVEREHLLKAVAQAASRRGTGS